MGDGVCLCLHLRPYAILQPIRCCHACEDGYALLTSCHERGLTYSPRRMSSSLLHRCLSALRADLQTGLVTFPPPSPPSAIIRRHLHRDEGHLQALKTSSGGGASTPTCLGKPRVGGGITRPAPSRLLPRSSARLFPSRRAPAPWCRDPIARRR
ncbi:hypothetical protein LY76DRAFT_371525 [Colletotrichum caudatum]|nr:hypothetical protein LY76DRAFT_371525 [Colletotrichum caudatum]